jgi:putative transposase
MTKRIAATEKTRERLRALIDGRLGTGADRSDLVRMAVQLIVEEVLEGEARDKLGPRAGRCGYRNGYRRGRMKTAEGTVEFSAPQLRETVEPFVSGVRENLAGRTEALEDLAVELFARGLSTRDIEAAFTDADGRRLVSRAAVSEITERLWVGGIRGLHAPRPVGVRHRLPVCRWHCRAAAGWLPARASDRRQGESGGTGKRSCCIS